MSFLILINFIYVGDIILFVNHSSNLLCPILTNVIRLYQLIYSRRLSLIQFFKININFFNAKEALLYKDLIDLKS